MNALWITVLASAVLGALGVVSFLWTLAGRELDHADRLALLPLELDERMATTQENPSQAHLVSPQTASHDRHRATEVGS